MVLHRCEFMPSILTKIFLAAAAILAMAGVILFFPFNFSDAHTCLFDLIVHAAATASNPAAEHTHPSELLRRYLIPYGLLWWSSIIAVLVLAIAWLRRQKKPQEFLTAQHQSRKTS